LIAAALAVFTAVALARSGREGNGLPALAAAPGFVGPSYYAKFSNGPPAKQGYFPILTYQANLDQWPPLARRMRAMGITGVDDAYSAPPGVDFSRARRVGLTFNVVPPDGLAADLRSVRWRLVVSYAMQDEPDSTGSRYAASSCQPDADVCAEAFVNDADAVRRTDPTRPVWGNLTKDVDEWTDPPSGWTPGQFQHHVGELVDALDITSADYYGWTDPYEWSQARPGVPGHYGAWVYGHTVGRLERYNPRAPAYGFVECCDSAGASGSNGNGTVKPTNEMMPGMLQAAVWNLLVHGARGIVYWTANFWDLSPHGDPYADPYRGASYQAYFALYAEHQWDSQYNAARAVDRQIKTFAPELNAPTVAGIRASSRVGVPVAALGKDYDGKLWLLVQADGDVDHPLSNTHPMVATVTLPNTIPAGTALAVVGERRTVVVNARHQFRDTFATTTETPFSGIPITYGYAHHIYELR
jgi:hypothetical protein